MSEATNIQWCDSTVSLSTGCEGCELWRFVPETGRAAGPCYAGALHEGRLAKSLPGLYAPEFTEVRLAPGRMAKAAAWRDLAGVPRPGKPWIGPETPRLVFVGDMADTFSEAVPFDYIESELIGAATSPKGRRHVWMVLTKRARRLHDFAAWLAGKGVGWPANVWCGVSVTAGRTARRAEWLCRAKVGTRFVSYEPALEWVDLSPYLGNFDDSGELRPGVGLVIVGGESRQGKREARPFDVQWARQTIHDCHKFGVSAFVKQLGSAPFDSARRISIDGPDSHAVALDLADSHGGDWDEWPAGLRVREMPAVAIPAGGAR